MLKITLTKHGNGENKQLQSSSQAKQIDNSTAM